MTFKVDLVASGRTAFGSCWVSGCGLHGLGLFQSHDWMLDPLLIWGAWTPGQCFGLFVVFIKLFLNGFYRGLGHVGMFVEAVLL